MPAMVTLSGTSMYESCATLPRALPERPSPLKTAVVSIVSGTAGGADTGLGILTHQVIVDRRDRDATPRQLNEDPAQFRAQKHEVAHQHGVLGVVAEACPCAESQLRRNGDVLQVERDVAPGQVEAMVATGENVRRLQNATD